MTFNTLETIYYLLKQDMEKRQSAYKVARDALEAAYSYEDDASRISSLKHEKETLWSEYCQVRDAFNDFVSKSWN